MDWCPARACTPRESRSPAPSVLAVPLLGMACCKARAAGIEWHTSVSSVKDWRGKHHQFGGNRHFRKPQLEPSGSLICYLGLNQPEKSIAEHILTNAQDSRPVVQDFVPLAESLEWELGQQYLRDRGNKAFISDASPVPFVINNDGTLSCNAAEVFFTSLVEAEKSGELEPAIYVLELGIGVGLFARFFLDHMQHLCEKHKKDFYDRLIYIAADRS